MLDSRRSVAALLLLPFTAACGVEQLPPPQTPDKVMPEVAYMPGPPQPGQGRLVVDSASGPAQVDLVLNRGVAFAQVGNYVGTFGTITTASLCKTTPCAVNLPYGQYELLMRSRTDDERVSSDIAMVGQRPSVYRHNLGVQSEGTAARGWGVISLVLGVSAAAAGGTMAAVGSVDSSADHTGSSTGSSIQTAGYVTLGIGAALTVLGAALMYAGRPRFQPGSSVEWQPDGAPDAPSTGEVGGIGTKI